MSIRVLQIFANARGMNIPPPVIGLFTGILRADGHYPFLFDTTGYRIPGFRDATESRKEKLYYLPTSIKPGSEAENVMRRLGEIEKLDVYDELERKIQNSSPDLLLLTVTDSTFLIAVQLLKEMKRRFKRLPPALFGGVPCAFAPELLIQYPEVDMICTGEGEGPLRELCRRIERRQNFNDIPGIWVKRRFWTRRGLVWWRRQEEAIKNRPDHGLAVDELNNLPLPDYSLFEDFRFVRLTPVALEKETDDRGNHWRTLAVHAMRGCPFECGFCYAKPMQDLFAGRDKGFSFFRKRSVESVRREIAHLIKHSRMTYVFFSDDTFLARSTKEIEELCEMLREFKVTIQGETIQLPFWNNTRPETISPQLDGHRKVELLKKSGLHWMAFGLEHGNELYRKKYVRRNYSNQLMIDSMKVAQDMKIRYSVNGIIGFPFETRSLVFDTIELNRAIHPSDAKSNFSCSTFAPFFGTELRKVAEEAGFISRDLICASNSADSTLDMGNHFYEGERCLTREEIKGLGLTFAMYVRFPKDRWPEIRRAEAFTPEGNEIRARLAKEYKEKYLQEPETRIDYLTEPTDSVLPDQEISMM